MVTHDFKTQLADGAKGEAFLDSLFAERYNIKPATWGEQGTGIDRWFTNRETDERKAVEYKTDHRAFGTGNAFIETMSVDTDGKRGWAYTSQANILVYYLPEGGLVYILPMAKLREVLPLWANRYPKRAAKNRGYNTWGLCVPLREFERHAIEVINL